MCSSWGIVMEMKSIPEGFQLSSTFGLESALEPNLWPMVMFLYYIFL